jgi:hypothetical protein
VISRRTAQAFGPTEFVNPMNNVVSLVPKAPARVSEGELLGLVLSARLQAELTHGKDWKLLVLALEELKDRRWEETRRG